MKLTFIYVENPVTIRWSREEKNSFISVRENYEPYNTVK